MEGKHYLESKIRLAIKSLFFPSDTLSLLYAEVIFTFIWINLPTLLFPLSGVACESDNFFIDVYTEVWQLLYKIIYNFKTLCVFSDQVIFILL